MTDAAELRGRIGLDLSDLERDLRRAEGLIRKFRDEVNGGSRSGAAGMDELGASVRGVSSAFHALGIAYGAVELGRMAVDATKAANELEKVQATTLALAGSQERYAEVLRIAQQGQRQFGGSLADNLSGFGKLVNASNRYGIELSKLDNLVRRLAIVDPLQGAEGGAYALKELLSNQGATATLSLRNRFELDREALRPIEDGSVSAAEKIRLLDEALNQLGITNDVLTNRTETTAAAYDRLGAAASNFQTAVGGALAQAGEKAAESGAALLNWLAGAGDAQAGAIGFTDSLMRLLGGLTSNADMMNGLSESERQLAESFLRSIGVLDEKEAAQQAATASAAGLAAANEATAAALLRAFQEGRIGPEQYAAAMDKLRAAQEQQAAAAQQSGDATQQSAEASQDAALKAQLEAVQKKAAAAENDRLAQAAQRAADAVIAGGGDIVGTAARLASSSNLVDQLTAAYIRLALAQGAADRAAGQQRLRNQAANTRDNTGGRGVVVGAPGRQGNTLEDFDRNVKAMNEAAEAQKRYQFETANSAGKLKMLRDELAGVEVGSAKYYDLLTQISGEESKAARAAASGGRARVSEAEKTANRLIEIEQQTAERLAEIDRRVAEQRAASQRALAETLITSANDIRVANESNDLDLIGATGDRALSLADRERAEADARIRYIESVDEARRISAEQDAQLAQAVFGVRQDQIRAQQALDERYYERQRELPAESQQALTAEYQQATEAIAQQAQDRIGFAELEAQQRAQAIEAEKQAAVQAAADQAAALGRTGDAAKGAKGQVEVLAGALRALPKEVTTTVTIRTVGAVPGASSGGSGTAAQAPRARPGRVAAAGGGAFLTSGPTTFVVGDNPGGVELVSVTPISGRGVTSASGNVIRMAGGGQAVVDSAAGRAADRVRGVQTPVADGQARQQRRRGRSTEEMDAEYARRTQQLLELERGYLDERQRQQEAAFRYELDRDIQLERSRRDFQRQLRQQTEALNRQQEARERELTQQARERAAAETARAVGRAESEVLARRNAALLSAERRYQSDALRIVNEGRGAQSDIEQFWHRARLADLNASFQDERRDTIADYERRAEDARRAAESARGDAERDAERVARDQAEAEFQVRRDALEDQQFIDRAIRDRAYREFENQTRTHLDALNDAWASFWRSQFAVLPGGEERFRELSGSRRALGGSVRAGQAYAVGERGPELFIPQFSGRIAPSVPAGGGGVTYDLSGMSVTIGAGNGVTPAQVKGILRQVVTEVVDAQARKGDVMRKLGTR